VFFLTGGQQLPFWHPLRLLIFSAPLQTAGCSKNRHPKTFPNAQTLGIFRLALVVASVIVVMTSSI
jgi:hypothetical protein